MNRILEAAVLLFLLGWTAILQGEQAALERQFDGLECVMRPITILEGE